MGNAVAVQPKRRNSIVVNNNHILFKIPTSTLHREFISFRFEQEYKENLTLDKSNWDRVIKDVSDAIKMGGLVDVSEILLKHNKKDNSFTYANEIREFLKKIEMEYPILPKFRSQAVVEYIRQRFYGMFELKNSTLYTRNIISQHHDIYEKTLKCINPKRVCDLYKITKTKYPKPDDVEKCIETSLKVFNTMKNNISTWFPKVLDPIRDLNRQQAYLQFVVKSNTPMNIHKRFVEETSNIENANEKAIQFFEYIYKCIYYKKKCYYFQKIAELYPKEYLFRLTTIVESLFDSIEATITM